MRTPRVVAKHPLSAVMLVAVVARGLYFLAFSAGSDDPLLLGGGDGVEYWALGKHLTQQFSFDVPGFLYRPPGYPLVIALELVATPGSSEWVPIVVNELLSIGIVPLTYLLATNLGLSRRCGLLAALIMAVEPTSSLWGATPLSEPLEAVVLVGAIILAAAAVRCPAHALRYAALAGVAAAAALIVKPAAVGLVVVLAIILVAGLWRPLGPRSVAPAALVIAITLIPYVGWTYSNEKNFGVATFSSLGNFHLYFVRGTSVLRRVTGKPPTVIEQELADRLSRRLGSAPSPSKDFDYYRETTDERAIDEMGALARGIAKDHPVWFAAMYPVSAVKLFFAPGFGFPVIAYAAIQGVLYLIALVGLRRLWAARRRLTFWTIVGIVGYVTFLTTTGHGSPNARYLVPIMPLIAVAAAVALVPREDIKQPSGASPQLAPE